MPPTPASRCQVCALPSRDAVCSRRCAGLRGLHAAAAGLSADLLAALPPRPEVADPGDVALQVLHTAGLRVADARDALTVTRGQWLALREAGRVQAVVKGVAVPRGKEAPLGGWRVRRA